MNSLMFKACALAGAGVLVFSGMALADTLDFLSPGDREFKPPLSRFPAGMKDAPVPDDSDASRQAAINRLRQGGSRHPVCPGSNYEAPTRLGTACGTREFDGPPLIETPQVQWFNNRGWWAGNPFIVVGDRLFSVSCGNETNKGLSAFDTGTGKVLWTYKKICDVKDSQGAGPFFTLPNEILLLPAGPHMVQSLFDVKTGKLLSEDKFFLNWQNMQQFGTNFVTHVGFKNKPKYIALRGPDRHMPLWKIDDFVGDCPTWGQPEICTSYQISDFASYNGILYVSAADKNQADPVSRQLHAIDMQTGKILWKHTDQPVTLVYKGTKKAKRSDDSTPMVVDGKVIVRIEGQLGWQLSFKESVSSYSYRALDARTGAEVWTTAPIPTRFQEEWLPKIRFAQKTQAVGFHIIAGNMLVTTVTGNMPGYRELWAYRLTDGQPAWRRPMIQDQESIGGIKLSLAASAGGVLYLMGGKHIMALDAETGTYLWTFTKPPPSVDDYYENFGLSGGNSLFAENLREYFFDVHWDDGWIIGTDGAFYGVTPQGPFKIR